MIAKWLELAAMGLIAAGVVFLLWDLWRSQW
jgi:hypothetical protein